MAPSDPSGTVLEDFLRVRRLLDVATGGESGGASFYTKLRGDGDGDAKAKLRINSSGQIQHFGNNQLATSSYMEDNGTNYSFASFDLSGTNIYTSNNKI